METRPISFSRFSLKASNGEVSCDVYYNGCIYRAMEFYNEREDRIRTDDNAMMRAAGLLRIAGGAFGFWRFLDVEPGSEAEIEATRLEELILSKLRAFIDRQRAAALREAA